MEQDGKVEFESQGDGWDRGKSDFHAGNESSHPVQAELELTFAFPLNITRTNHLSVSSA